MDDCEITGFRVIGTSVRRQLSSPLSKDKLCARDERHRLDDVVLCLLAFAVNTPRAEAANIV